MTIVCVACSGACKLVAASHLTARGWVVRSATHMHVGGGSVESEASRETLFMPS